MYLRQHSSDPQNYLLKIDENISAKGIPLYRFM